MICSFHLKLSVSQVTAKVKMALLVGLKKKKKKIRVWNWKKQQQYQREGKVAIIVVDKPEFLTVDSQNYLTLC